ncbi:helix-turn-helix domain-containing protein [Vagococcus bubulae]|uniref:helix-turn-helix domain-containing protein n=1 Tax=Vagococcus bubulae TaxID=1977868 RepID=UPI0022E637BD|nr:helix-turn-helix domain-containing protein [Vagococcus bubulae]
MFIEDVILYCFKSGDVMRYSTLYHLLKGKKTTSVLSYGKLYAILDYFYLFPKLSKTLFDSSIHSLVESGDLHQLDDQFVKLTDKGKARSQNSALNQFSIKGFDYYKFDDLFWQRLLFISQVISYKSYQNADYLPIDNDPIHQLKIKQWLRQYTSDTLVIDFFNEWKQLMGLLTQEEQDVLVSQLVGHDVVGYTLSQFAKQTNHDVLYVYLLYKSSLHKMIEQLLLGVNGFPLIFSILASIEEERENDTVDVTSSLIEKGYSINQISHMRRLKESTITDHFIEMSLSKKGMDLIDYVTIDHQTKLKAYLADNPVYKSWKFSDVIKTIPSLTFYEFKFYQFYLLEEGDN